MIRNTKKWRRFEDDYLRNENTSLDQKKRQVEALYLQAKRLGAFESGEPLTILQHKIRLARALNTDVRRPTG